MCILILPIAANRPVSEEEMNKLKDVYNKHADKVPGIIVTIFGNEKSVLYVDDYDPVYFVMENGYILEIGYGELPDKTMNVYTNEETINEIVRGETTFTKALYSGKIRYEGVDLVSSVKAGVINIFTTISSWFG